MGIEQVSQFLIYTRSSTRNTIGQFLNSIRADRPGIGVTMLGYYNGDVGTYS